MDDVDALAAGHHAPAPRAPRARQARQARQAEPRGQRRRHRGHRGFRATAATAATAAAVTLLTGACGTAQVISTPSATSTTTASPATPSPPPTGALALSGTPGLPQTILGGLPAPWDVVTLPTGGALVSDRVSARLQLVRANGTSMPVVGTAAGGGLADVVAGTTGGLIGLTASPTFATDHLLYAFITTATDARVVKVALQPGPAGTAGVLSAPQPVLTGIPTGTTDLGGRIAFGPDGDLYIGTGDAGVPAAAQDPRSLAGKVLRVTAAGQPAPGNPTPGSAVWASGFHDVQAFAWDAGGRLYATDTGDALRTQDELDVLQAGGDYGWPAVEGEVAPNAAVKGRYAPPLRIWYYKNLDPQGMVITADAIYITGATGQSVWRIPLTAETIGTPQRLLSGVIGRLRDITAGPDGTLWLTTTDLSQSGSPWRRAQVRRPDDERLVRLPLG